MSFIRGYDRENLRELVDIDECAVRLEEIEDQRSLPALLERVWLLKVLGRLDEALALAETTVRQARMAGTSKDVLRARVPASRMRISAGRARRRVAESPRHPHR